jgi:hypothetical protein
MNSIIIIILLLLLGFGKMHEKGVLNPRANGAERRSGR